MYEHNQVNQSSQPARSWNEGVAQSQQLQHQHEVHYSHHYQPLEHANGRSSPETQPDMASVHPSYQYPHDYRLPNPQQGFYQHPQQSQQYQHQAGPAPTAQSAPRQRTAIACRYCRRRKIRCSGFENSADGRCTNCQRFNQECLFTPVSAQTQAFVPAQAVYGRGRGAVPPLYGAFGQPLAGHQGQPVYGLPSPTHHYPPYAQQGAYLPGPHEARRTGEDPHTPALPPPSRTVEDGRHAYSYPDPTTYANQNGGQASPASSTASYHSHPAQPYYPAQRTSPSAATPYAHDQARPPQDSPHAPAHTTYSQAVPVSAVAVSHDGRTPPPGSYQSGEPARNGLSIRDMISDAGSNGSGERGAVDSDMVSALNRTSRR